MINGYFVPVVTYKNPNADRSDAVLKYIGSRVLTSNKNLLCAITGQTGSGKSYSGVAICERYSKMFDIPFDVDVHTIHTLKQLVHLIRTKELEKKIQRGTPLLFEEPQATDGNARNWQQEANKMLAVLLSTFRNQNLVVFFTTPFLGDIDKQSRKLFHAEFKIVAFDPNTKLTTIKPRFLEYNGDTEIFYKKKLIVNYAREGKRFFGKEKVSVWQVPKASQALLDAYEVIKAKFSVDLIEKLWNKLTKEEASKEEDDAASKFFKVKQLYDKYGEDYVKILSEYPVIGPKTLENYIRFIKKSANAPANATSST